MLFFLSQKDKYISISQSIDWNDSFFLLFTEQCVFYVCICLSKNISREYNRSNSITTHYTDFDHHHQQEDLITCKYVQSRNYVSRNSQKTKNITKFSWKTKKNVLCSISFRSVQLLWRCPRLRMTSIRLCRQWPGSRTM